jgi:hypothetical protein
VPEEQRSQQQPQQQQQQQQHHHPTAEASASAAAPTPGAAVRLATALEAGYAYARQCVRAGHGIRLLKQLLQPQPAAPSHFISEQARVSAMLVTD